MIESARERAGLLRGKDYAVTTDGVTILGIFDEPDGADLDLSGQGPTFLATRLALANAAVFIDTVLTIYTHAGRALGNYRVAVWSPEDDGEFILMRLDKE